MEPLLKYPGGKRRISDYIIGQMKDVLGRGRYIEPFAGGAAVFFKLEPKSAILSDVNKPIINFYEAIQREPSAVYDEILRLLELPHTEETYNRIRADWNGHDFGVKFAAKLLYMNKNGFNGLFRLNKELGYNVAWGKKPKQPAFPTLEELKQASDLLRRTKLYVADFSKIIPRAKKFDSLYVDPPYWDTYDRYAGSGFNNDQQQKLARQLHKAHQRGVSVFASNIDCEGVRQAYQHWTNIEVVSLLHKIGCTTESRKTVDEVFMMAKYYNKNPKQLELYE